MKTKISFEKYENINDTLGKTQYEDLEIIFDKEDNYISANNLLKQFSV